VNTREYIAKSRRVREHAAELRTLAIDMQLITGFTWCRVVETELLFGHVAEAENLLAYLGHSVHSISKHLNEPRHVTESELPSLQNRLRALESEIRNIKTRLERSSRY
jgi:hypothetical protein